MSPSAGTNSSRLFLNSQQFSDNIFDNPSCQSATVCMYVYSESVGQSLVVPLIAAVTQWLGILCLFFWLVSVLVLIMVPRIRIIYI